MAGGSLLRSVVVCTVYGLPRKHRVMGRSRRKAPTTFTTITLIRATHQLAEPKPDRPTP